MFERIAEFLSENLKVERSQITPETHLQQDLGISSFDIINLICGVEEEFGVTIPDRMIYSFMTVKDIVTYLEENAA